jgi:hypothetical protein
MEIWLAHLSGPQGSSQISGKKVERNGARLLVSCSAASRPTVTSTRPCVVAEAWLVG